MIRRTFLTALLAPLAAPLAKLVGRKKPSPHVSQIGDIELWDFQKELLAGMQSRLGIDANVVYTVTTHGAFPIDVESYLYPEPA